MDALDPSEGMLEAAREKNLYQKYICTFFTDNVDVIKTSECYIACPLTIMCLISP